MATVDDAMLILLIVGFFIGFLLAFSMGANDVSNAFGTSYGSRVLTFAQVCILASIFETLGSVLLGGRVSDTIAKGIADLDLFKNTVYELMYGYLSALVGASGWLLIATIFKLPVSGTHSIVGAVVGFTMVARGPGGVKWMTLVKVVSSWFTSPLLSGIVSSLLFLAVKYLVLEKANPLDAGCKLLPVMYGITFAVISFMIIDESTSLFFSGFREQLSIWAIVLIATGLGLFCWLITFILVMPLLRDKILRRMNKLRRRQLNLTYETGSILSLPRSQTTRTQRVKVWFRRNSALIWKNLSGINFRCKYNNQKISVPSDQSLSTVAARVDDEEMRYSYPNPVYLEAYASAETVVAEVASLAESESYTSPSNSNLPRSSSLSNTVGTRPLVESPPIFVISSSSGSVNHRSPSREMQIEHGNVPINEPAPTNGDNEPPVDVIETPEIRQLFSFIQVITATFASFSHGANDVSNAVGPIIGMFEIYTANQIVTESKAQWWILLFGGVAMSIGLWLLGKKVMKTIGDNLTSISPATGFCMELGTALTVLIASHLGVPISTTHCLVGSVVFVSLVRSRRSVDWRIARNIAFSWLVTLPASGLISAGCMAAIRAIFDATRTFQYWDYFHPPRTV